MKGSLFINLKERCNYEDKKRKYISLGVKRIKLDKTKKYRWLCSLSQVVLHQTLPGAITACQNRFRTLLKIRVRSAKSLY